MGSINLMNVVVGIVLVFLLGVVMFVPSENYNEITGEVVGSECRSYEDCSNNEFCWDHAGAGSDAIRVGERFGTCTQRGPGCSDSDGGRIAWEAGQLRFLVTDDGGNTYYWTAGPRDECLDGFNLKEYYCGSGSEQSQQVMNCGRGNVCRNGACVAGTSSLNPRKNLGRIDTPEGRAKDARASRSVSKSSLGRRFAGLFGSDL